MLMSTSRTSFSRFFGFSVLGGTLVWHLWIGRARHPDLGAASFAVEVPNVGGWLTHGVWSRTRRLIFGCCGTSVDSR